MQLDIECLTDGALVLGQRMRAGELREITLRDEDIAKLRVLVAAGDISADLPDANDVITSARAPLAKLKGDDK